MSKIQWTGKTWNPIRARNLETGKVGWFCEHASDGCRFCYAETMNKWRGNGLEFARQNRERVEIFLDDAKLVEPLSWRKPQNVFPCSMTDIGAEFVTDAMLDAMVAVMARAAHLTFQPLTKRPERMHQYLMSLPERERVWDCNSGLDFIELPLPNVHLGTSIEQSRHIDRLDDLRATPAALRWISFEPLLEDLGAVDLTGIGWVVIGGESGRRARPFYLRWAEALIEQCRDAGVPVFMKQIGDRPMGLDGQAFAKRADKGGDPAEWPESLRIRQFPATGSV